MALVEEAGAGAAAAAADPEALLNEWLGELTVLTAGLNSSSDTSPTALRPLEIVAPRIDTYRFSMANLEETQDSDLDAILGELCALDSEYDEEISRTSSGFAKPILPALGSCASTKSCLSKECQSVSSGSTRADSPDNDSAFSDTVSMLSSESSASSSASSKCKALQLNLQQNQKDRNFQQKADKIKLALERMREANVKKLFIKAFSMDGSSKSLLVDEKMTCGYVTRLLADKNHVAMEPKWAIVEQLPDLYMERVYEDHEMLVENLMLWTRESKNKILFAERNDKICLFQNPEKFLLDEDDKGRWSEHDEHSRQVILEDFFGSSRGGSAGAGPVLGGHPVPPLEGPLYLKSDSRKGWKQFHCVIRPSGLYYTAKDKVKNVKELVCLATFDTTEVYIGVNWKKKYKSPTDYCFAIKHPKLQQPKSAKFIKFLCAEDRQTLDRWLTAIRIAKHGRQLLDNHRTLVEELTQEDLDHLAHARSCSISSIPQKSVSGSAAAAGSPASAPCSASSAASGVSSDISGSSGRHSRASSSSSSGCMSDGGTASESAFDCDYSMGTIKRKPSMKPNIPLTWMTRQLKEMAETSEAGVAGAGGDEEGGDGGTLTRRPRYPPPPRHDHHATLKRRNTHDATDSSSCSSALNLRASPARSPSYVHYECIGGGLKIEVADNVEARELPPPPPQTMFSSTLSLDLLPPPPPPPPDAESLEELAELALPPPPPELALYSQPATAAFAEYATIAPITHADNIYERTSTIKKVNFAENGTVIGDAKKNKRITFDLNPQIVPASPRKPPPPVRRESTRLSSPKKLADSASNPPKEFLKDLQKVMRKKWQVAQKCALEPATSPHEVLGFREYPPVSEEYKESSVSMWVREHYGAAGEGGGGGAGEARSLRRPRAPPPPPPPRADSTHLSHAAAAAYAARPQTIH